MALSWTLVIHSISFNFSDCIFITCQFSKILNFVQLSFLPWYLTVSGMKSLGIIRFEAHELASLGCGLLSCPVTPKLMRDRIIEYPLKLQSFIPSVVCSLILELYYSYFFINRPKMVIAGFPLSSLKIIVCPPLSLKPQIISSLSDAISILYVYCPEL